MKYYLLIFALLLASVSLLAQTPKISNLTVLGENNKWYNASSGGTEYPDPANTALVHGQTYYASQTVNGVESTARLAVTATVNVAPTPTFTLQPGAIAYRGIEVTYTTETGKSNYVWTFTGVLSTDYTITSGGTSTDNSVTLRWSTTGSKTVTINYTNNACSAASATYSTATNVSNLTVGQTFQGGKIAYILRSGDPGYLAGQTHGLIAALADQSIGAEWITGGSTQTTWNGNTSTALGKGQANTNFMKAQAGYTGGAAKVCDDYTNTETGTGVFSDWYLPSQNEIAVLCASYSHIGGFTAEKYWCSSEYTDGSNARKYTFYFCNPGWDTKVSLRYVRAVRSLIYKLILFQTENMKRYFLLFALLLSVARLLAQTPTISSLVVTGSNIKWYNASSGSKPYTNPAKANLENELLFQASQAIQIAFRFAGPDLQQLTNHTAGKYRLE